MHRPFVSPHANLQPLRQWTHGCGSPIVAPRLLAPDKPTIMEGHSSQLVVFGAVAISLIVLIRRLRALEATLADRTAALDAARNQPKAHPPVLSLLASTHTAPAPSLNGHSSRTSQSHRTCEATPAPFTGTKGGTDDGGGKRNLFDLLPPETLRCIFEALPAVA